MTALAYFGFVPKSYAATTVDYTINDGTISITDSSSMVADITVLFARMPLPDVSNRYIWGAAKMVTTTEMDRNWTGATVSNLTTYYSNNTNIYRAVALSDVTEFEVENDTGVDVEGFPYAGPYYTLTYDYDGAVTRVTVRGLAIDEGQSYHTSTTPNAYLAESYMFMPTGSQSDYNAGFIWCDKMRYNNMSMAWPVLFDKWEVSNDYSEHNNTHIYRYTLSGIVRDTVIF